MVVVVVITDCGDSSGSCSGCGTSSSGVGVSGCCGSGSSYNTAGGGCMW